MFEKKHNYDSLADEVRAYLARFAYFPTDEALDVATLWAFHTHAVGNDGTLVFAGTPRLAILSQGPASGKTRVMELISSVSRNGKNVTDPSAPGLLTLINEEKATLAIDEIDQLFGKGATQRPIKTILNSGYRPGATVPRYGKDMQTFAPVILAGMMQQFTTSEHLRPTYTRSICILMQPKPNDVTIDPWRERLHKPIADSLARAMAFWGKDNASALAESWPELPDGVEDRAADIWEPLLATAESIGPEWTERAFDACKMFVLSEAPNSNRPISPLERLLMDIAKVFTEDMETIGTADLLSKLSEVNQYWAKIPNPQSAAMELSAMLKPLGVSPVKVWINEKPKQGYKRAHLIEHLPVSDESSIDDEDMDAELLPL